MVKVAILGYGTVGGGVAEILTKNGNKLLQKITFCGILHYIINFTE